MRANARKAQSYFFKPLIALIIAAVTFATNTVARPAQESQEKSAAPPAAKSKSPDILISPEEDYRIGPRDVIEVQVEKAPELSGSWNVSAKGTFLMPYVGRVVALNKTPDELAQFITERLRGDYLKDPRVKVVVKQYNSRSFFIQGAIRSPGVYQVEGQASLLKLIILAGGLNENHGSTAFVIRELKSNANSNQDGQPAAGDADAAVTTVSDTKNTEKYELLKVNISGLLKGHFDQNMMIEPGDIINIPATDVFFVAGEVRAPGSYPLKEGTTLRQAISLAQGSTFKAAASRGIIFREEPGTGKRTDIKVDIGAIMSGKKPDVPIMANDVIIVPNSRMKSVSSALLSAFGMHAVIRGLPPY